MQFLQGAEIIAQLQ